MRSAIVAKTVADVNRGKGQAPYKVEDFMPKFKGPGDEGPMPWENMLQKMRAYTAAVGGEDLTDGDDSDTGN